jgi:hypothetical protein
VDSKVSFSLLMDSQIKLCAMIAFVYISNKFTSAFNVPLCILMLFCLTGLIVVTCLYYIPFELRLGLFMRTCLHHIPFAPLDALIIYIH